MLGLDVGAKRTGIARASSVAKIAQPLTSAPTTEIMRKLQELIEELGVSAVAVGLPRNLSGDDTAQTAWVRGWVDRAKKHFQDLPFYWQDEALTSKLAAAKQASGKKPTDDHALAAAIILQDFLDTPETGRVMC